MRKDTRPAETEHYVRLFGLERLCGERVLEGMSLWTCAKGERLCAAGVAMTNLYMLVQGKLKVYSPLPNGKSVLIRFIEPPGIVGDVEWATGYPPRCTVEAMADSALLAVSFDHLAKTAENDARWMRYLMQQMARKLHTNSNTLSLNLLYPVENRVASYLLSIAAEHNPGANVGELRSPSLLEMAEWIGTSYRHLNRVLARFAEERLVTRRRGAIGIVDADRLKRLAEGLYYD